MKVAAEDGCWETEGAVAFVMSEAAAAGSARLFWRISITGGIGDDRRSGDGSATSFFKNSSAAIFL